MPAATLQSLVSACDRVLRPAAFKDWDGAVNGLQVENRGQVSRLAAAVDASLETVELAIRQRADFLLVHHGLFWTRRVPWTGVNYQLLRRLLDHNLAVYSAHLPLDAHPRLGNNVLLARALGFARTSPFLEVHGTAIGRLAVTRLARPALAARLRAAVGGGSVTVLPSGPEVCRRIGICCGGAGEDLARAAQAGVDTFITGEGPHWTYALSQELRVNVLYAGHYATETFGVRALAELLGRRFSLPTSFIEAASGL